MELCATCSLSTLRVRSDLLALLLNDFYWNARP